MRILEIVSTMGPSRRADVKVVEMVLLAEAGETQSLERISGDLRLQLLPRLEALNLPVDAVQWQEIENRDSAIARIAGYACMTALALQNAAGHKLYFHDFLQDQDPSTAEWRYRFIFQHDDIPSGEQAGDLAMCILAETCPSLGWKPLLHDGSQPITANIAAFIAGSRPFVTPPETLALIAAAQARGVPVLRLEREPYGKLSASFRVAPNGMIMLGHSRHRVIMDGLFCLDRAGPAFNIMNDRRALWQLLVELGVQAPVDEQSMLAVASPLRARRSARRLGYPLWVRPLQRNPSAVNGWQVENENQLDALLAQPGMNNCSFLLEPERPGPCLQLLFAGGKMLAALLDDQIVAADTETTELAQRIERAMNCGFLLVTCGRGNDPGPAWRITDLNPSPSPPALLQHQPELLNAAYESFLDWLYPPGESCRIPIVAVTGTNGKTTTCSMIAGIAKAASKFVGLARTTGVYFNEELKEFADRSGFKGHCMVFEHPEVDLAVLETARGDVLRTGFAYDFSDVAICTNVTADHLGEHGVETVADMAVVKRSVLERSAGAVVLNGDDPLCLEMIAHLPGKTLIVSTFLPEPGELRQQAVAAHHGPVNIIHVAQHQGERWIVLHEGEERIPVIAVNSIPATFNGAARHNISNAMHAIAGAYALGLGLDHIRQALTVFKMGYDSLPGRLNLHDNGKIQIIMDYAHNADGLKQLVGFTDQYPCAGRKVLRFGVSPYASKAACWGAASIVAGHYDYYLCAAKPGPAPEGGIDTANELRLALMEKGVREDQLEIFTDVNRAVEYPVSLCQPGDLLVLVTPSASLAATWEKIIQA